MSIFQKTPNATKKVKGNFNCMLIVCGPNTFSAKLETNYFWTQISIFVDQNEKCKLLILCILSHFLSAEIL